jgi:DNA-binding NarL/FixJ family response regulator
MEAPDIRYTTAKDGTRIAYGLYPGHGAPVLTAAPPGEMNFARLHKNPAFVAMIDEELAGRRAVRFDWRGMGLSAPLTPPISVAHQAMDLEAVCAAVGERVDLITWCMASFPAVTVAVARPELVRSLIMAVPDYEGSDSHYASLFAIRATMDDLDWREMIVRNDQDLPGAEAHAVAKYWQREVPLEVFDAHLAASMAGSLAELAPRLSIPTGVIAGARARRQAEAVMSAIPHASYRYVDEFHVNAESGRALRELRELVTGRAAPSANGHVPAAISDRECEVLAAIASGASNSEVAERLSISTRTVERHVQNIYIKLGVHNRVEAANWAREHGVV